LLQLRQECAQNERRDDRKGGRLSKMAGAKRKSPAEAGLL